MKIIAIEGLDKSGKATISKLLTDALVRDGYRVVQSEFHRYDTPTGKLIMDWLTKKWDVDQVTIELIMAADKQAQQKWFEELERQGVDVLILDRYTLSQLAYSQAQANGVYLAFEQTLQNYMRQPDHNIVIDIPGEVSMNRKGKHNNGENDRYEEDVEMLERVRKFMKMFTREPVPVYAVGDYSKLQALPHHLAMRKHLWIDGTQSIEEVFQLAYEFVSFKLNR